jgi:hypothetical protein
MGAVEALENHGNLRLQSPPAAGLPARRRALRHGSAGMRDSPGTRSSRRPTPAMLSLLVAMSLAGGSLALPVVDPAAAAAKPRVKQPRKPTTLTLKSSLTRRAQAAGSTLPFTIRLRRSYEGGPGDDVVALDWDPSATAWPLPGTAPAATPAITSLDGALSYQWDFGADTSGYATMGTVETQIGGGIAMVGSGFPIAAPEGTSCTTLQALDATGVSFTSAGARFGTVNPFSGEVSGTLSLRTAIRTRLTPCGGPPASATALARTTASDPPLPVAFTGRFSVSPSITADGRVRLGILRILDTAEAPQRSTFGLVQACTDPAAADGCDRRAFPVRTRLRSMTAEVLAGDALPPLPGDPPVPAVPVPAAPAP